MSKLRSDADYEREIAEVDQLIRMEEAVAETHGMDFATELTIHSLRARRRALLAEMEVLGNAPTGGCAAATPAAMAGGAGSR